MILSHHAYFLTGNCKQALEFLDKNLDIQKQGNPDYFFSIVPTLSIDEARALKVLHSKKPFSKKRISIIQTDSIPVESQNALLKLFEEPEPDNHFFIILKNSQILPTLRSRVQIIHFEETDNSAEHFLKLSKKDRLEYVAKLDKVAGYSLAQDIARIKKDKNTLEAVVRVQRYIHDRGSSTKQLLEYLALTV